MVDVQYTDVKGQGVQPATGRTVQGVQLAAGPPRDKEFNQQLRMRSAARGAQPAVRQGVQTIQPAVGHAVKGIQPAVGQEDLHAVG